MDLIIGDGLIGRNLCYYLRQFRGVHLTRRSEVDLSKDRWEIPGCKVAYICAGKTSTVECRDFPEATRLVNVINTVKLSRELLERGTFVVWISSERVFDGTMSYRGIDGRTCPTTEYGRQKEEAERELLGLGVTVVRFSKVIGWSVPLFEGWVECLGNGQAIHPYSNVAMSPMSVRFAVEVLYKLAKEQMQGLYQVSADVDISYAQGANYIANYLGLDIGKVVPVESLEPHLHTTLESNIEGIDIPDAWVTIQDWCKNRKHELLLGRAY